VTSGSAQAARWARDLEAQVDDYPDERGQILVEAGEYWHRAGEHDRAIDTLNRAIALGGEDGGIARVSLADLLFDLDRTDQAQAQLDDLRRERPAAPVPYHLAAELLEGRGELVQALSWINMAVSRLTDEELAQQRDESGLWSYANNVLASRRRIRRALEMPDDELDESVHEFDESVLDGLVSGLRRARVPQEVRILFWPRDEIPRAHEKWPHLVEHADVHAIVRERETANRELATDGVARINMVPLTVARLADFAERTGGDPADGQTRQACMEEIAKDGRMISWPPGRNQPCWCGSATKYKKCCGRPT
jgi:hypothetical protein